MRYSQRHSNCSHMTQIEIDQVNEFIAQLKSTHEAELAVSRRCHIAEKRAREIAQQDSLKMGQAVHELWKLAKQQPPVTPEQLAHYIPQIINYYCPDFDVPF